MRALRAVRRLLVETGATVLHTHMAKAGSVGRLAARTVHPSPRTVHTFHGHVLRGYFGERRERTFTRIERWLARTTDALVAPSAEVRDDLAALGVAPRDHFEVIRYGFDFPPPSAARERLRATLGIRDGTFVVGFAGRLTAIKRPLDLVRAVAREGGLPVVLFCAGGIATPADAALMMQLGAEGIFVGSGIFKSEDPATRAAAIVEATTHYADPARVARASEGLGTAMQSLEARRLEDEQLLASRGW